MEKDSHPLQQENPHVLERVSRRWKIGFCGEGEMAEVPGGFSAVHQRSGAGASYWPSHRAVLPVPIPSITPVLACAWCPRAATSTQQGPVRHWGLAAKASFTHAHSARRKSKSFRDVYFYFHPSSCLFLAKVYAALALAEDWWNVAFPSDVMLFSGQQDSLLLSLPV